MLFINQILLAKYISLVFKFTKTHQEYSFSLLLNLDLFVCLKVPRLETQSTKVSYCIDFFSLQPSGDIFLLISIRSFGDSYKASMKNYFLKNETLSQFVQLKA